MRSSHAKNAHKTCSKCSEHPDVKTKIYKDRYFAQPTTVSRSALINPASTTWIEAASASRGLSARSGQEPLKDSVFSDVLKKTTSEQLRGFRIHQNSLHVIFCDLASQWTSLLLQNLCSSISHSVAPTAWMLPAFNTKAGISLRYYRMINIWCRYDFWHCDACFC